jgi:hypothetical protein
MKKFAEIKKIARIFIPCMILLSADVYSQDFKIDWKPMGWYPCGEKDTINVEIVMTDTVSSNLIVINGYEEREKSVYHGDPMPPGDYSDRWRCVGYLDERKNRIAVGKVWMSRGR